MSVQERVFDKLACSTPLEKLVESTAGEEAVLSVLLELIGA